MNDPLVHEIRQFRHKHTQQFSGDLAAICDDLRNIQQTCGHPVVTFPPKRVSTRSHQRQTSEIAEQVAA